MSAILPVTTPSAAEHISHAFSRLFGSYYVRTLRYFSHRSAIASLHELDDGALQDMGLARSEIEAAVHGLITRPNHKRT